MAGDIGQWLEDVGLGRYAEIFADNDIDADLLPHLTEQDLTDLGLSIGHRRQVTSGACRAVQRAGGRTAAAAPILVTPNGGNSPSCFAIWSVQPHCHAASIRKTWAQSSRAYQQVCTTIIEKWQGRVAKYMGDGLMAYFGYPTASEHDAENAVRAALDLIDENAKALRRRRARPSGTQWYRHRFGHGRRVDWRRHRPGRGGGRRCAKSGSEIGSRRGTKYRGHRGGYLAFDHRSVRTRSLGAAGSERYRRAGAGLAGAWRRARPRAVSRQPKPLT